MNHSELSIMVIKLSMTMPIHFLFISIIYQRYYKSLTIFENDNYLAFSVTMVIIFSSTNQSPLLCSFNLSPEIGYFPVPMIFLVIIFIRFNLTFYTICSFSKYEPISLYFCFFAIRFIG